MTLTKSNPLVRTSSSFQLFLLDRLRQYSQPDEGNAEVGLGFGSLSDPVDDEAVWQIEDWLDQNEKDFELMVFILGNKGG